MTHVTMDQTFLWDLKFFWDPTYFQYNKFVGPKNFQTRSLLCPKFFSEPKFFQTQIFFRPKICSDLKWISMKMIFGGIKQRFWTSGFLNCPSQRFYLNWSLTLKTKSCISFYLVSLAGLLVQSALFVHIEPRLLFLWKVQIEF